MSRALFLALLLAFSPAAASDAVWEDPAGASLLGAGLAGTWYDFRRGLFLVIEPTGPAYRVTPVLLERRADGMLRNRYQGLTIQARLIKETLGFRGQGTPEGDAEGLTWLLEGSVRRVALNRLEGEIRVEVAPFADPPLPSQSITLHRYDRAPTLSIFESGTPRARPRADLPAPPERDVPVSISIDYLPEKTDVPQAERGEGLDIDPRRRRLTVKSRESWTLDRDAAW